MDLSKLLKQEKKNILEKETIFQKINLLIESTEFKSFYEKKENINDKELLFSNKELSYILIQEKCTPSNIFRFFFYLCVEFKKSQYIKKKMNIYINFFEQEKIKEMCLDLINQLHKKIESILTEIESDQEKENWWLFVCDVQKIICEIAQQENKMFFIYNENFIKCVQFLAKHKKKEKIFLFVQCLITSNSVFVEKTFEKVLVLIESFFIVLNITSTLKMIECSFDVIKEIGRLFIFSNKKNIEIKKKILEKYINSILYVIEQLEDWFWYSVCLFKALETNIIQPNEEVITKTIISFLSKRTTFLNLSKKFENILFIKGSIKKENMFEIMKQKWSKLIHPACSILLEYFLSNDINEKKVEDAIKALKMLFFEKNKTMYFSLYQNIIIHFLFYSSAPLKIDIISKKLECSLFKNTSFLIMKLFLSLNNSNEKEFYFDQKKNIFYICPKYYFDFQKNLFRETGLLQNYLYQKIFLYNFYENHVIKAKKKENIRKILITLYLQKEERKKKYFSYIQKEIVSKKELKKLILEKTENRIKQQKEEDEKKRKELMEQREKMFIEKNIKKKQDLEKRKEEKKEIINKTNNIFKIIKETDYIIRAIRKNETILIKEMSSSYKQNISIQFEQIEKLNEEVLFYKKENENHWNNVFFENTKQIKNFLKELKEKREETFQERLKEGKKKIEEEKKAFLSANKISDIPPPTKKKYVPPKKRVNV